MKHEMVEKGIVGGLRFYQCEKCGATCIEEYLARTENEDCE